MSAPNDKSGGDTLTLGRVIDGFFHLSEQDKVLFLRAIGADKDQPTNKATNVVSGNIPKSLVLQQASGLVKAGSTIDPKTGRIYRLCPKKGHTADRQVLEEDKEAKRTSLVNFCIDQKITRDGNKSVIGLTQYNSKEYNDLLKSFEESKVALNAYKNKHPQEFEAPPNKKKGKAVVQPNQAIQPKAPNVPIQAKIQPQKYTSVSPGMAKATIVALGPGNSGPAVNPQPIAAVSKLETPVNRGGKKFMRTLRRKEISVPEESSGSSSILEGTGEYPVFPSGPLDQVKEEISFMADLSHT